jgi:hypothetical protein
VIPCRLVRFYSREQLGSSSRSSNGAWSVSFETSKPPPKRTQRAPLPPVLRHEGLRNGAKRPRRRGVNISERREGRVPERLSPQAAPYSPSYRLALVIPG